MHDLISRQAAIEAVERIFDRCEEIEAHLPEGDPDRVGYKMYHDWLTVWKYLHQLPSAQPEPLTEAEVIICKMYLDDLDKHKTCNEYKLLMGLLDGTASAQPEQRWMNWIPVDIKNDSPEENEAVLLGVRFKDDFKYFVTSRQDYNYWTGLGREIKGELRWLPLPSPYQKEGEK